jgi:hypothetical protein
MSEMTTRAPTRVEPRLSTPEPARLPTAAESLQSNIDAQMAMAEARDGVCYAPNADGYRAAMEHDGPQIGPLPPGGARSHPLEGNAVYEWGREGGGYDQATHPWRMFNDLAQIMVPGTDWRLPTPVGGAMNRARR